MAEQRLSADLFEPLVGRTFDITFPDGTLHLTLRNVTRLPPPRRLDEKGEEVVVDADARKDPFTLLFGGASHLVPQRIYRLQPDATAEPFEIFIVPVGQDREGFIYQAVFG